MASLAQWWWHGRQPEPIPQFEYDSLEPDHIRVLTILPGQGSDRIFLQVRHRLVCHGSTRFLGSVLLLGSQTEQAEPGHHSCKRMVLPAASWSAQTSITPCWPCDRLRRDHCASRSMQCASTRPRPSKSQGRFDSSTAFIHEPGTLSYGLLKQAKIATMFLMSSQRTD
jgi:hypothetical protein